MTPVAFPCAMCGAVQCSAVRCGVVWCSAVRWPCGAVRAVPYHSRAYCMPSACAGPTAIPLAGGCGCGGGRQLQVRRRLLLVVFIVPVQPYTCSQCLNVSSNSAQQAIVPHSAVIGHAQATQTTLAQAHAHTHVPYELHPTHDPPCG